ncbi:hypothetical protein [Klebsiella pneumoniae]|uniref:hypothetical protein n=1 Tax=Klebsiella pneumoniae TaxID=573 RepID=UPI0037C1730B
MGEISVKTGNNARNGGKNSLNRLIRCVCGKKIGPDPRNFNQRVSLGRNDLLIRTFLRVKIGTEKPFTIKTRHPADISNNHGLIISPKDAKIIADRITDLVDNDQIPSKDKTMTVILPSYSVGAQKFIFDVSMFYCLPYTRQCK